jgi:hypothetical protein
MEWLKITEYCENKSFSSGQFIRECIDDLIQRGSPLATIHHTVRQNYNVKISEYQNRSLIQIGEKFGRSCQCLIRAEAMEKVQVRQPIQVASVPVKPLKTAKEEKVEEVEQCPKCKRMSL